MSFILDALKKSEAERQLGEVPSLQSVGELTPMKGSKRSWYLFLLILLLVLVAIGWFWQNYTVGDAEEVSLISEAKKPAASSEPVYRPAKKLPHIASKKTPVGEYTPSADVKTFSNGMDLPDTGKVISITQNLPDSENPDKMQTANKAGITAPVKAQKQQRLNKLKLQREAEYDEDAALVAAVDQRLAGKKTVGTQKSKGVVKNKKTKSIRLYELPVSVRSSLPEINISMQVYSMDTESRFAIVNGKRYVESDMIAESVVLDEILRKGVILKYRQYRILVD